MTSEGSPGLPGRGTTRHAPRPGGHPVGAAAMLAFLEQAAASLAFECLAVLPIDDCSTVSPGAVRHLYRQILGRGVQVRTLYPEPARDSPGVRDYARWTVTLGAAVRTAPVLPPHMFIFDRGLVLLPEDQRDRSKGSVLITDDSVVSALHLAFDQTWRSAAPFGGPPDDDADPGRAPTGTELRLLRLLADGSTDASAGRQLGMSLRTVRRMTAGLMRRLEAGSRFEAGRKAAQRGWL